MTIAEALANTKTALKRALIDSADAEAYLLLSELLNLSRNELVLLGDNVLSNKEEIILKQWLERRVKYEPLQYILGKTHFYGLEIKVTPAVLIPRPETESLVALALETIKNISLPKVIDVGTGSGAISLAIKHECPNAEVLGVDIAPKALEIAKQNAERLNLKVDFCLSDLLEQIQEQTQLADLIVANLPYLPLQDALKVAAEIRAEPPKALFAGKDGLEIFRRLLEQANKFLKQDCVMILELDPRNIRTAFNETSDWQSRSIECDLTGRERFLVLKRSL